MRVFMGWGELTFINFLIMYKNNTCVPLSQSCLVMKASRPDNQNNTNNNEHLLNIYFRPGMILTCLTHYPNSEIRPF